MEAIINSAQRTTATEEKENKKNTTHTQKDIQHEKQHSIEYVVVVSFPCRGLWLKWLRVFFFSCGICAELLFR